MTIGSSLRLRQTLAYTVRANDTAGTFPGFRQTLAYTVRAQDDRRYFSGADEDPSLHCYG